MCVCSCFRVNVVIESPSIFSPMLSCSAGDSGVRACAWSVTDWASVGALLKCAGLLLEEVTLMPHLSGGAGC